MGDLLLDRLIYEAFVREGWQPEITSIANEAQLQPLFLNQILYREHEPTAFLTHWWNFTLQPISLPVAIIEYLFRTHRRSTARLLAHRVSVIIHEILVADGFTLDHWWRNTMVPFLLNEQAVLVVPALPPPPPPAVQAPVPLPPPPPAVQAPAPLPPPPPPVQAPVPLFVVPELGVWPVTKKLTRTDASKSEARFKFLKRDRFEETILDPIRASFPNFDQTNSADINLDAAQARKTYAMKFRRYSDGTYGLSGEWAIVIDDLQLKVEDIVKFRWVEGSMEIRKS